MMVILEYLLVGAGAAILLIVLAKVLMAKLLQREEGYYEGGMIPKMIASAQFDENEPTLTEEPMDELAAKKLAEEMAAKEAAHAAALAEKTQQEAEAVAEAVVTEETEKGGVQ